MPKFNPKMIQSGVEAEMAKWRGRSRIAKNSNFIAYGKIKSALDQMEKKGNKQQLNNLASFIGKQFVLLFAIIKWKTSYRNSN